MRWRRHAAFQERLRGPAGQEGSAGGALAGLLQEGLAAPHTLLVDSLEVGLIPIIGVFDNELVLWIIAPK